MTERGSEISMAEGDSDTNEAMQVFSAVKVRVRYIDYTMT